MNILFPLVRAGSGSDIFTYNLVSGLNNLSVHADVQYLPGWTGYVPSLMGRICRPEGYDLIHANTWNGFSFTKIKPTVVTAHSAVRLPELKNIRVFHNVRSTVCLEKEASSLKTAEYSAVK